LAFDILGQETYFYNGNKKVTIKEDHSKKYITFNSGNLKEFSKNITFFSEVIPISIPSSIRKSEFEVFANHNFWSIITSDTYSDFTSSSEVQYNSPIYRIDDQEVIISHYFYVKLKTGNDDKKLLDMAKEYDVIIVGSDEFMPLWYILAVDKTSKRNTVELSNIFYESGKFDFSEPDILVEYTLDCENDPLFPNQWNLKNTGQSGGISGMDIAACQAWDITKGCQNITVAVFDQGLEFNHPDFGSFSTQSFDAQTGTLGSQVRGYHGVFVAGIIAAQHNNIGISGVSPNITLMSISESFANTPGFSQRLASGINFAWNNGADIIQNSWSSNNIIQPQFVQDAINLAANSGRGGLGCIIVHSTGNDQQNTINFPSNLPNVIAVGSINRNGIRANLSNYGTGIDLVAGGEDIYSTDRLGTLGINTHTSPNA
jgi:subtilisin family serine protease